MVDREMREECISNLIQQIGWIEDIDAHKFPGWGHTVNAMRQAIALLKAQEPNEDWISRKRLKDEIQYYIDEAGWGDEVNKVLGWCMEFIDNQRAVKWE